MSKRFAHGLVVGKFSPLHRGHEFLIGRALAECRRVTVLSYSKPQYPRCGAALRREWLRRCAPAATAVVFDDAELARLCRIRDVDARPIPSNAAPDDTQREFVAWICLQLLKIRIDAVFSSEAYGDGFADHLSRAFVARDAGHPGIAHRLVDLPRTAWPVRGTDVRDSPAAWRSWVDPFVYADLVPRLCILGGESSGKTTLALALAQKMGAMLVPEYGRTHWDKTRQDLPLRELEVVAQTQVEHEIEAAQQTPRWLVCDTSPLTTLAYALLDHGLPSRRLVALSRRQYDLVVLCRPDIPFVQDGTRRDAAWRESQHALTTALLRRRGLHWMEVSGSPEERMAQVLERLP